MSNDTTKNEDEATSTTEGDGANQAKNAPRVRSRRLTTSVRAGAKPAPAGDSIDPTGALDPESGSGASTWSCRG